MSACVASRYVLLLMLICVYQGAGGLAATRQLALHYLYLFTTYHLLRPSACASTWSAAIFFLLTIHYLLLPDLLPVAAHDLQLSSVCSLSQARGRISEPQGKRGRIR